MANVKSNFSLYIGFGVHTDASIEVDTSGNGNSENLSHIKINAEGQLTFSISLDGRTLIIEVAGQEAKELPKVLRKLASKLIEITAYAENLDDEEPDE